MRFVTTIVPTPPRDRADEERAQQRVDDEAVLKRERQRAVVGHRHQRFADPGVELAHDAIAGTRSRGLIEQHFRVEVREHASGLAAEEHRAIDAGHRVGHRAHLRKIVSDPQHGDALRGELANQRCEALGAHLVHARHRLIEHEQRGRRQKGLCEEDALPLAARTGYQACGGACRAGQLARARRARAPGCVC